jgi:hypothetical protein
LQLCCELSIYPPPIPGAFQLRKALKTRGQGNSGGTKSAKGHSPPIDIFVTYL